MDRTVPISVVIPTMNRPETLERTLSSYVSGEMVPEQIIIIDQTQDEQIRLKVKQTAVNYGCQYLFQENPSLTAARNVGQSVANNEILICSDDDVDIYIDTIENIWNIMQDEAIALIAGTDDLTGVSQTNVGYLLGTKSYTKRNIGHVTSSVLGRYPDHVTTEIETEWAMGFFFVVRKSCIEKWNLKWDERLISYAYAEDLDYSYRYCRQAKTDGMKCILSDKVHVKHLVSKEYRIPSRKSTYMYAIHRRYISDKSHLGSWMAMGWCDLWRIVERIIKRENPGELIDAIKAAKKLKQNLYANMEEIIRNA